MIDRRRFMELAKIAACLPVLGAPTSPARARETRVIVSGGGIKLWLVEERSAPLVALRFGVPRGSTQDPPGREGLTSFLLAMLEEGAGGLDANAFKDALKATATELSLSSARDRLTGGIVSLEGALERSADLLRMALEAPRFDAGSIARVRRQLTTRIALVASDSGQIALDAWYGLAYPGHVYGRSASGTQASLDAIGRDDLVAHHRRLIARDGLRVVIVGSIGDRDAALLTDRIFGSLPAKGQARPIPPVPDLGARRRAIIMREQALSAAVFGLQGRSTMHADYAPALLLNHIMGSGDFDARLVDEVRVKRGLTYAIRTSLVSDSSIAVLLGQLSTRNEAMGEALAVIEAELSRMARSGPTEEEVTNAKSYLSGSLLLGFDGSAKLADGLLGQWLDGDGVNALAQRRKAIERVQLSDVARVAAELLRTDRLLTVVVGQPGMTPL